MTKDERRMLTELADDWADMAKKYASNIDREQDTMAYMFGRCAEELRALLQRVAS